MRERKDGPPPMGDGGPEEIGRMRTEMIHIRLAFGRKLEIHRDTYQAACRAIRIFASDERVAAYAGDISPEIAAQIRATMIGRGELPRSAYSRRHEALRPAGRRDPAKMRQPHDLRAASNSMRARGA